MSFSDEITKDVVEVEQLAPLFFLWQGTAYPCVADKFTREVIVSDNGNPVHLDLSLRVSAELFPNHTFPVSGDTIRFPVLIDGADAPDSQDYTCRRTRSKQLSILWVDCIDENV